MSKLASAAILISFLFTNVAIVGALANTPNVDATNSSAAFTTDLTQLGRQGRLRENPNFENEISALVEILEKGGTRQPIILDEKGESQDMIVDQLAIRVAKGDVPQPLKGVLVKKLEDDVLFSNSKNGTDLSAKLNKELDAIEGSASKTILFINDVSSLLNAAGGRLAKDIAAGKLTVVAGSSQAAFKQNIEPNGDLAKLFAPIVVDENALSAANETSADLRKGGYAGDNLSPFIPHLTKHVFGLGGGFVPHPPPFFLHFGK